MTSWFAQAAPHLLIAPILLPMFTAAVLIAVREKNRNLRAGINVASCLLNLLVVILLVYWIKEQNAASAFAVYLSANWDIPFGIPLLADRFSALMLLITALIALAVSIFSIGRWDRAGVHFYTLFQVQVMGINGAFLTADLFNLFVFFEILLAASYGLALHGSGSRRVRAGLHYIAINLVASFVFLIGIALIYNSAGTLNFADIAQYARSEAGRSNGMLFTGFAVLAMAFLTKAGMWPINFWLVPTYSSSSPPAAAMFAMLTKVGMYVLLRLSCLFFANPEQSAEHWFGNIWLTYGGLLTLFFGAVGFLSTMRPPLLAAYATLVSAGTLMSVISLGQVTLTSAALYYLPASTLAVAAFFLIAELIERDSDIQKADLPDKETDEDRLLLRSYIQEPRSRKEEETLKALEKKRLEALITQKEETKAQKNEGDESEKDHPEITVNLDEREEEIVGRIIPAALAFLGISFACCALLIAGLPPLSSFIAKFGMLDALLHPKGPSNTSAVLISPVRWSMIGLIIMSGFFALLSFSRAGIRYFWSPMDKPTPHLRVVECVPIIILLTACVFLAMRAEVSLRYTRATSVALYTPSYYIEALLSARPTPAPNNEKRLQQPVPENVAESFSNEGAIP